MKKTKKKDTIYLPLYKAVEKYIKSKGGTAVVIGGISIGQEWGTQKYNYFIQIKITGIMPSKKEMTSLT